MAQNRNGANVAGVVTVSSPHAGSYLANIDQARLTAIMAVPAVYLWLGCDISGFNVCGNKQYFAAAIGAVVAPILLQEFVPVTKQMSTRSSFANEINARGDANYRTAGVRNVIWNRWTMWRVLADNQKCDGYQMVDCDAVSATYVRNIDRLYHHFTNCAIVSGLLGIVWSGSRDVARGCALNAGLLLTADWAYKRMSVGSHRGDGVVHEPSQLYPGSSVQVLVDDSNSHVGVTRSRMTANGIAFALNQALQTPIVQ
jgi:hypothetical protein